ncbi:MAG TPA: ABC transporter substrate-binding protein, partial [Cytophagaceae bacterium]
MNTDLKPVRIKKMPASIKSLQHLLTIAIAFGFIVGSLQCTHNKEYSQKDTSKNGGGLDKVKYSNGFEIIDNDSFKIVNVFFPNNRQKLLYKYLLIRRGDKRPLGYEDAIVIETPVRSFIALSTMYVAYAEQLDVLEKLKGISEIKYVNSKKALQLHAENKIKDLGINSSLNIEAIYALKPEIIVCYTYGNSNYEIHPKLHQAGLKLAVHAEQLETSPLGRMEWIKFFALLFEKEVLADSIFKETEKSYYKIKAIAATAEASPTVFTDIKYGDTWFMPGGRSYLAQLLLDAHTSYLWSSDTNKGSIPLSFEAVYEKAHNADYWINLSDWHNK